MCQSALKQKKHSSSPLQTGLKVYWSDIMLAGVQQDVITSNVRGMMHLDSEIIKLIVLEPNQEETKLEIKTITHSNNTVITMQIMMTMLITMMKNTTDGVKNVCRYITCVVFYLITFLVLFKFTDITHEFSLVSLNCNGFNGSQGYIQDILREYDVTFMCEHWLRQDELSLVQKTLCKDEYWSMLKSSMNPEEPILGRPYGGVGFFCKKKKCVDYKNIECNICDRLGFIQVCSNGIVKLNVLGVYLPYWNNTKDQLELYCETLDKMQSLMDTYCGTAPLLILGDMNTSLPHTSLLYQNWCKKTPFNSYSVILYNFIVDNNLYVVNFMYDQNVNFTYQKGGKVSYIDHVLASVHLDDNIKQCSIQSDDANNVSDHYAMSVRLLLSLESAQTMDIPCNCTKEEVYPRMNWRNELLIKRYNQNIKCGLKSLYLEDTSNIKTTNEAEHYVEQLSEKLCSTIHNACRDSIINQKSHRENYRTSKKWWSVHCSEARKRNKFWFSIWRECGRPPSGEVYLCYKEAKNIFR